MAKRRNKDPLELISSPVLQCHRSELDLFTPPKEQDAFVSSHAVLYSSMSSLDNDGPVVFSIPPVDEFTDLSKTRLTITVKVEKSNGEKLPTVSTAASTLAGPEVTSAAKGEVSIPNDFFDTLMRKVMLEINSVRTGSDHMYFPQVGLLKNLLSYPESVGNANLKHAILWMTDEGDEFRDAINAIRFKFIAASKEVTMIGRLSHDVFNSTRLLPPGNNLKITIERSAPDFALIRKANSAQTYRIKWIDARVSVHRVKVSDSVAGEAERRIKGGSIIYMPFSRTDARSFEVPSGSTHYRAQALFSGVLPERVLLVLADPAGLGSGVYSNNPMIFPASEFAVSHVQFFIDERAVLTKPYKPDWEKKEYLHEYQGLLSVMNLDNSVVGSCMNYSMFGQDYGIFAANMRGTDGKEQGIISVELRFSPASKKAVSGLMIPEFRSCIIIDSNRNVSQMDY